jgi:hypothetical protein
MELLVIIILGIVIPVIGLITGPSFDEIIKQQRGYDE